MIYIFRNVTIDPSAVSEATAEVFETRTGKLLNADNTDDLPAFDADAVLDLKVLPIQDFQIVVKRNSQGVNAGTGGYTFALYIASVGVEPSDGIYKADISVHS